MEGNTLNMPKAIIVDLDGTVASNDWRNPYHFHKCIEDLPNHDVINIVNLAKRDGKRIIILTGRPVSCKIQSCSWLRFHGIDYDDCYFRPDSDRRKGWMYKQEVLPEIQSKYNVIFFMDDDENVFREFSKVGLLGIKVTGNSLDPSGSTLNPLNIKYDNESGRITGFDA